MIHLFNNELDVAILDPVTDRDRFGPRYCTGGYLYQVSDRTLGPLLAGPEYPSDHPSVINGQGAPEVFQHTLYYDPNAVPEKKLIIGVGLVENSRNFTNLQSHFTSNVDRFCTWETEMSDTRLETRAYQQYEEWSLSLWRIMVLEGRSLSLRNRLLNDGPAPFLFRWFAHPFFPVREDMKCCQFTPSFPISENPGFLLDPSGTVKMKREYDWRKGHFQEIPEARGISLAATSLHPLIGTVRVSGDFPLLKLALWANDRTFSIEPFFSQTVEPDAEVSWELAYEFGTP